MRILINFSLLLACIGFVQAQTPQYPTGLQKISAQAPNAAALGKFGAIPVSQSTGVPNISIPVFEINVGGVILPISLNYHSSGFRVNEPASNVGLGWALSAAPQVSRNVVGLPDEGSSGFFDGPALTNDPAVISQNYLKYYQANSGDRDLEPDRFSYSMGGQSGGFVFKKDQSIFQIPLSDNKIVYNSGNFLITNTQGVKYTFDQREQSHQNNYAPGYDRQGSSYINNWYASKITSATGIDEISFSYATDCGESAYYVTNYSTKVGILPKADFTEDYEEDGTNITSSQTLNYFRALNVSSIAFKTGKVDFIYACDRLDFPNASRLKEVQVYRKVASGYELIKKIVLTHSYFHYNPDPSGNTISSKIYHRLRLDQVQVFGSDASLPPQTYAMTYDNTPMAPINSNGQDRWGFNNGKFGNMTLIPVTDYMRNGRLYHFGSADRSTDAAYLKACMLKEITYPTGGKTAFEFEPHKFKMREPKVEVRLHELYTSGVHPGANLVVVDFSVPANEPYAHNATIDYFISRYNYPGIVDRPYIKIEDLTSGDVRKIGNANGAQDYSSNGQIPFLLVAGHSYKLSASVPTEPYGTTPVEATSAYVRATIRYVSQTDQEDIRSEGGLRIRTITNYNTNGEQIGQELYKYGINENGLGILLSNSDALYRNYNDVTYRYGYSDRIGGSGMYTCVYNEGDLARTFQSSDVVPLTQLSGSPVVYGDVTRYQLSPSGVTNGKQVSTFTIGADDAMSIPTEFNSLGQFFISNTWKSGLPASIENYKYVNNDYKLISKETNTYLEDRKISFENTKFQNKYSHSGCEIQGSFQIQLDYVFFTYSISSGHIFLTSTEKTTVDDAGRESKIVQNFTYGNTSHLNITQMQSTTSRNEQVVQSFLYPVDKAAAGNVYQKMVDRNMTASVVEAASTLNANPTSRTVITYQDWFGDSKVLLPSLIEQSLQSNPLEAKAHFFHYDGSGNLLEQAKDADVSTVYLWGYDGQYPVAEIKNATYNQVKTALGVAVNTEVNLGAAGLSASQITQLRSALPQAMITTYTYDPLVGMSSSTDANGVTTFYEYDGFQRLKAVREQNASHQAGNVLKSYQYHYKQ